MPAGKQAGRESVSRSPSQSGSWAAGFDRFVSGASEGIDAAVNASKGSGRALSAYVLCVGSWRQG